MVIKQQLALMDRVSEKHRNTLGVNKSQRELIFLREMYPLMFIKPKVNDYYVGRKLDLPVYFGLNNLKDTKGYIGYVYNESLMDKYYNDITSKSFKNRLNLIKEYWSENNFSKLLIKNHHIKPLNGVSVVPSINSLNLDFNILLRKGVLGIRKYLESINSNDFIDSALQSIFLLEHVIDYYIELVSKGDYTQKELMIKTLNNLKKYPPKTLHESAQLIYLYKQLSGVENYNEIKDYLGNYVEQRAKTDEEVRKYFYEFIALMDYNQHPGVNDPKLRVEVKFDATKIHNRFKKRNNQSIESFNNMFDNIIMDTKNYIKEVISIIRQNFSYNYASILNQECLDKKTSIIDIIPVELYVLDVDNFIEDIYQLMKDDMEYSKEYFANEIHKKINTLEE